MDGAFALFSNAQCGEKKQMPHKYLSVGVGVGGGRWGAGILLTDRLFTVPYFSVKS